jgi:hypothetical protein
MRMIKDIKNQHIEREDERFRVIAVSNTSNYERVEVEDEE